MLILTRRPGEAVVIDGGITVRVVSVHGGQVRLGFDAPPDTVINRAEFDRELAAGHDIPDLEEQTRTRPRSGPLDSSTSRPAESAP